MEIKSFKNNFLKFCSENKLEINDNQIEIIDSLTKFYKKSFTRSFFSKLFNKKSNINGFYLFGDVGVGKTMLLNFFFNNLDISKQRLHFNEFMINFHDYAHSRDDVSKNNSIISFVKNLKKRSQLIYFDEFQVTNIVDAMILGKLFKTMFSEDIKIIITSNTKIKDLYKDGLQRERFIPFINTMIEKCNEIELKINEDYRKSKLNVLERFFYPLNEKTNFKINQIFRKITKEKTLSYKDLEIKGRTFKIKRYYDKIARFDFKELCDQNIGAEDYIEISNSCDFIVIENIPKFEDSNVNQQLRFITLIDIFYEKKTPLMVSSNSNLDNIGSSISLKKPFKRTLSRLYELTSIKIDI